MPSLNQTRLLILYASAVLLLLLAHPVQPAHGAAIGRVLNKDHDIVFAEQAKARLKSKTKERKPFLACPGGLIPCLITADGESASSDVYECVDVSTSLQSCGACSLRRNQDGEIEDGEGTDCSVIKNVKSVECRAGKCHILSCKAGFSPTSLGCV